MLAKKLPLSLLFVVLAAMVSGSGCTTQGPALGFLAFPIPVSPYFQDREEDKFWIKERYDRVPILGPLTSGGPWPSILRAMTR
jgi:hypothetical protein